MTTRRWKCPVCATGWNAPGRMRRDDVRRYCLECSASTGRLVEMGCPALDTARHEAKERAAAKAKRQRATATARKKRDAREKALGLAVRRIIAGFDVDAEADRIWNLPVFKENRRSMSRPPIEIRRSARKLHSSGHSSYSGRRIVITVGRDQAEALGVLLHELVHPIAGPGKRGEHFHHHARFWSLNERAAREAWPEAKFPFHLTTRRAWDRQHLVTRGLADWLERADDTGS